MGFFSAIKDLLREWKEDDDKLKSRKDAPIISQFSDMPRYYKIDGIDFDIDNPQDIYKIPLFDKIIEINGEKYGMDSILLEHGEKAKSKNERIYAACVQKVREYRSSGIVFQSAKERSGEIAPPWLEKDKKWAERQEQIKTFGIEDMKQFVDIPFGWHWVMELEHSNNRAWFMLNMNNQQVALQYISQIKELIQDARNYVDGINNCNIDLDAIDFGYPVPMHLDSLPNTYVECLPYTKTGKVSKYPAILHFSITGFKEGVLGDKIQTFPVMGSIKILKDGNIGAADVVFLETGYLKCTIGLYGLSLVLKRVDTMEGNIFNFNKLKDE